MRRFDHTAIEWEKVSPNHFTGKARLQRVAAVDGDPKIRIYQVEFEASAITHWHIHSGVQLLYIAQGQCRFQKWGEAVSVANAGDIVVIPANEKHWHGASPEGKMIHIAVNINATTTWMGPVANPK